MDKRLAHLTEVEIGELIERYYKKEKVRLLLEEYKIDAKPSQLLKLLPPKITEKICPYCHVNMITKRTSRDYSFRNTPKCLSCNHEDNAYCRCSNCKEKELIRIMKERDDKREFLNYLLHIDEDDKVDFESLDFEERIYLGALLREGISEDFSYIKPIEIFNNPLTPTQDLTKEVVTHLEKKRIIVIHPNSDLESFESIDRESGSFRFYLFKVKWALNVKKEGVEKVALVESLINPNIIVEPVLTYHLWRKIALHEALEYFYQNIRNVLGVEYTAGEKTISVLNDLINDYSVSQIYTIIYSCTNNALRFQVEKGVPRQHAANTVIGNAQNFAEKAKINEWKVQKYSRRIELPESALSRFFFQRILKIGFEGFNEKPRLIE